MFIEYNRDKAIINKEEYESFKELHKQLEVATAEINLLKSHNADLYNIIEMLTDKK